MKKIYAICAKSFSAIACFIFIQTLQAQPAPGIQADKTIGGGGTDNSAKVIQTKDGGYVICGISYSNLSGDKTVPSVRKYYSDIWIVRCSNTGEITWQSDIGSKDDDKFYDFKLTPDGGLIFVASSSGNIGGNKTENSRGKTDYWIVKLNNKGKIEWDKTYGGSYFDKPTVVAVASDGGYFIGGVSASNKSGDKTTDNFARDDYWLLKLDHNGNLEWQKDYGGKRPFDQGINSLVSTSDGCIIAGTTDAGISGNKNCAGYGSLDYWLIRLDNNGNEIWQKDYGGNDNDFCLYISEGDNNTFFVGGVSYSNISGIKTENLYGERDNWILYIDINGNIIWQKDLGGSRTEYIASVESTKDGGCIVGGVSNSPKSGVKSDNNHGSIEYDFDNWIVKLDKNGSIQWDKTIGGKGFESNGYIKQTINGGYIMCASSQSGISGDKTDTSRGGDDFWLVKLYPDTPSFSNNKNGPVENPEISAIKIYPNPAKDFLNIEGLDVNEKYTIFITDPQGNVLYNTMIQPGKSQINLPFMLKGNYFIKISDGKKIVTLQFMKE
ncbi:MAG: T9SS type A sorting domain-containing protein [Chitinophagaceae bacterium]